MSDEVAVNLTEFRMSSLAENSKISIIGRNTNPRYIFKQFAKYFENKEHLEAIMATLKPGKYLVIDETCPANRFSDTVFYLTK